VHNIAIEKFVEMLTIIMKPLQASYNTDIKGPTDADKRNYVLSSVTDLHLNKISINIF